MNPVHFSSQTSEWPTPDSFYLPLNEEFGFTLDVCATKQNAKCKRFFTREENGLKQDWSKHVNGGAAWMNCPYGREIPLWVEKAAKETAGGVLTVGLLPARTDTKWFHGFIYGRFQIRFVPGRLKFGGSKNSAPFPSMVVVFSP